MATKRKNAGKHSGKAASGRKVSKEQQSAHQQIQALILLAVSAFLLSKLSKKMPEIEAKIAADAEVK